jgi:hypothetical protein
LDSDEDGASRDQTEVVCLSRSPLKVLPTTNFGETIILLDSPNSDIKEEADFHIKEESEIVESAHDTGTVRKKLKFIADSPEQNSQQPVYETPPSKYSAERILNILLQPDKKESVR